MLLSRYPPEDVRLPGPSIHTIRMHGYLVTSIILVDTSCYKPFRLVPLIKTIQAHTTIYPQSALLQSRNRWDTISNPPDFDVIVSSLNLSNYYFQRDRNICTPDDG
jgi:hypothetical protein